MFNCQSFAYKPRFHPNGLPEQCGRQKVREYLDCQTKMENRFEITPDDYVSHFFFNLKNLNFFLIDHFLFNPLTNLISTITTQQQ